MNESYFELIGVWIGVLIFAGIVLVPFVFYLVTLQNTLKSISPRNRQMPPSNVWLMFIPLFGIIYHFIIVTSISDSIKAESFTKGFTIDEERPTHSIGMAMCILSCCSFIPCLGAFAGLAGLVCWIIYWVKVVNYKSRIESAIGFDFERNEFHKDNKFE